MYFIFIYMLEIKSTKILQFLNIKNLLLLHVISLEYEDILYLKSHKMIGRYIEEERVPKILTLTIYSGKRYPFPLF